MINKILSKSPFTCKSNDCSETAANITAAAPALLTTISGSFQHLSFTTMLCTESDTSSGARHLNLLFNYSTTLTSSLLVLLSPLGSEPKAVQPKQERRCSARRVSRNWEYCKTLFVQWCQNIKAKWHFQKNQKWRVLTTPRSFCRMPRGLLNANCLKVFPTKTKNKKNSNSKFYVCWVIETLDLLMSVCLFNDLLRITERILMNFLLEVSATDYMQASTQFKMASTAMSFENIKMLDRAKIWCGSIWLPSPTCTVSIIRSTLCVFCQEVPGATASVDTSSGSSWTLPKRTVLKPLSKCLCTCAY